MERTLTRFIVIDDDLINNMICRQTIKNTKPDLEVQVFNVPENGFVYIEKEYSNNDNEMFTILFLDINMPTWSGWDFLDNFDNLNDQIKKQFVIFMLSSSVDQKDIERAKNNKNVNDYIVKPLKKASVQEILDNYQIE